MDNSLEPLPGASAGVSMCHKQVSETMLDIPFFCNNSFLSFRLSVFLSLIHSHNWNSAKPQIICQGIIGYYSYGILRYIEWQT